MLFGISMFLAQFHWAIKASGCAFNQEPKTFYSASFGREPRTFVPPLSGLDRRLTISLCPS